MAAIVGSVSVSLDRSKLAARLKRGDEAAGPVLAEQIIHDCNLYSTPDDGAHALKNSAKPEKLADGCWAATWNTVYAAYQYYGCRPDGSRVIQNHTMDYTPNPSTQWCETAKARFGEDWGVVAQKEHTKGAR